jgi:hypothetical protein
MAAIFAVFLIALLAVFLRPEGRADRFSRARELFNRGTEVGKALLGRGYEAVDKLSADLAANDSQAGGIEDLLGPGEATPAAPSAE